jgi:hypothetical protein
MIKSPIGFLITAAALIFALSPEARHGARRLAVKGTEVFLDLKEQANPIKKLH